MNIIMCTKRGAWCAALAAMVACGPSEPGSKASTDDATVADSLRADVLASAEIIGVFEVPVRLTDGRYEGPPFVPGGASRPELLLVPEPRARGDMDGDGADEVVAVLAQSSGGSGTLIYLALMKQAESGWMNTETVLLGDRFRVQSLRIRDGELEASILVPAPGDPACCPTKMEMRRWTLDQDGHLEIGG